MNIPQDITLSDRMAAIADANRRATFVSRTYAHLTGAIFAFTVIQIALFKSGLAERIAQVSHQFLKFPVLVLGTLPTDPCVPRAVMLRQPWTELYPRAAATKAIRKLAARIVNGDTQSGTNGNGFIQRISTYFRSSAPA